MELKLSWTKINLFSFFLMRGLYAVRGFFFICFSSFKRGDAYKRISPERRVEKSSDLK